ASLRSRTPRGRDDRAASRARCLLGGAAARDGSNLLALLSTLVRRRPARAPRRGRLALRGHGAVGVQRARRARGPEPRLVQDVPAKANAQARRVLRARAAAADGAARGAARSRCEDGRRRARTPRPRDTRARPRSLPRSRPEADARARHPPCPVQLTSSPGRAPPVTTATAAHSRPILKVVMAAEGGRAFRI